MLLSIRRYNNDESRKRIGLMSVQPILQVCWWHDRQWSRLVSLVRDKALHFKQTQ